MRATHRWRMGLGLCALFLLAWTYVVVATAGVSFRVGPLLFRSYDVRRPLFLAVVCGLLYAFLGAPGQLKRELAATLAALRAVQARADRLSRWAPVVIAALSLGVLSTGIRYGIRAAGVSDVYGYVSQAELWEKGNLHVPIPERLVSVLPWPDAVQSVAPLGYRPGVSGHDLVPIYSPGLPLLMALFRRILGSEGQYYVGPVAGMLAIWITFWLGRHVTGRVSVGVAASVVLAASPPFLSSLVWPMSDLPVSVAWTVALYLALRGSVRASLASGAAAALAVLIRPNLAPLAVIFVAGLLWRAIAERGIRPSALWPMLAFAAGILPAVIGIALLNSDLYGSPLRSGYGRFSDLYSVGNIVPNLRLYLGWILECGCEYVLPGMAVVFLPWPRSLRPAGGGGPARVLLAGFILVVWLCYLPYFRFDAWTSLRFLLPLWPLAIVLTAALLLAVFDRVRVPVAAILLVVLAAGVSMEGRNWTRAIHLFDLCRGELRYVHGAAAFKMKTTPQAVIFALHHSGSLRYYAGRMTLRYDWVDPAWLDRGVESLVRHGYEPYIVLDEWEVPRFQERFERKSVVGRLDWLPVIRLGHVLVYEVPVPSTTPR